MDAFGETLSSNRCVYVSLLYRIVSISLTAGYKLARDANLSATDWTLAPQHLGLLLDGTITEQSKIYAGDHGPLEFGSGRWFEDVGGTPGCGELHKLCSISLDFWSYLDAIRACSLAGRRSRR